MRALFITRPNTIRMLTRMKKRANTSVKHKGLILTCEISRTYLHALASFYIYSRPLDYIQVDVYMI